MNTIIKSSRTAAAGLFATALLLGSSLARAEDGWHRKGTWETYGSAQYLFGDTVDFSKFGARLKVDDTALFGLGVGYPQQAAEVGRDFGSPLATMRDYLDRMCGSARVAYPRIVAANGPKMLAMAGARNWPSTTTRSSSAALLTRNITFDAADSRLCFEPGWAATILPTTPATGPLTVKRISPGTSAAASVGTPPTISF